MGPGNRSAIGTLVERTTRFLVLLHMPPSLSTSGETLTIEESMTLRARTETAGHVGDDHGWSWSR
jgi:hypothetical protein